MKKKKPKGKPKAPEWVTAEEDYIATGDVRYAALVIGRWPTSPPGWALKACMQFAKSPKARDLSAALAIGQNPNDPPKEAIDVCRELAKRCEMAHEPLLRAQHPGPKAYEMDNQSLEQMAGLIASGLSVRAAAIKVTEEEGGSATVQSSATVQRLERKWAKEYFEEKEGDNGIVEFHRREERALIDRARKKGLLLP